MSKENIRSLIDAIASGNSIAIENNFNDIMSEKIASRMDDMRVSVAGSMFGSSVNEESESIDEEKESLDEVKGVAPGDWHVMDDETGKIHSTHPTRRRALNAMEKMNNADYEQNKNDPTRKTGNIFQHRYSAVAKSYHDKKMG